MNTITTKTLFQQYEKYKDSGVDWIGEIPEGWEVRRLASLGRFTASGIDKLSFPNESKVKIINYTDIYRNLNREINSDMSFMEVTTPELNRKKNLVKKGDLIFLPSSETFEDLGLSALIKEDLENVSFSYHVLRFQFDVLVNNSFKKYFTNNFKILNSFSSRGTGSIRKTLNRNDFRNTFVILPPLSEQTAIAQFLDDKTTKIDQLIGIRQKEIELLKERRQILIQQAVTGKWSVVNGEWSMTPAEKLKPSGVDWIGEIPEHWEVRKLKSFCTAFGRIGFRGYTTADLVDEGDGAITISPSNIKETNMEFNSNSYLSWFKYNESPEIKIRENDILIVKTGSTYGKIGIVKNLPQKATINPQLLVLKKIQIKADYLYELLKSEIFQLQVERNVIGSTIPTISETKILGFSVPIPTSEEEINEISDYILNINEKIAKAISIKEQEIEKLKEYKTVLIDNVVTGKVRVS